MLPAKLHRPYWNLYRHALCDGELLRTTRAFTRLSAGDDPHLADALYRQRLGAFVSDLSRCVPDGMDEVARLWRERPVTTRSDLRRIQALGHPGTSGTATSTGGSTGTPVEILLSKAGFAGKRSRVLAARELMGCRPDMPVMAIWGSDEDIGVSPGRVQRLRRAVSPVAIDGGFTSSPERWQRLHDDLRSLRQPYAVYGYPSLLAGFSSWLQTAGLRLEGVAAAWVGAEPLEDRLRHDFRAVAGVGLSDLYGSRETGAIAVQRGSDGDLQVLGPQILVEVVDEEDRLVDEGATGRVLVSVLAKGGTSLLRYEIGDLAIAGRRSALGHVSLRRVVGRINDVIPVAGGRTVSSIVFNHLLKDYPAVRSYQLEAWPRDGRSVLKLDAPTLADDVAGQQELRDRAQALLPGYSIALALGADLAKTPRGKLRQVIVHEPT